MKRTRTKKYKITKPEWLCIIVLLFPMVSHLLIFWLGVTVESIRMAFTDVNTGELGLMNFEWVFSVFAAESANDLTLAFRNTMIFFLVSMIMIPVPIFFSYLIYRKCVGHSYMRLALYLPGAIGGIMMPLLYSKLMESQGPIMQLIQKMTGAERPIMMTVEHGVLYTVIYSILMGASANLLIWLGGMSRIPMDLIEYGQLEGVKPFQEFVHVILPLLWPTLVTIVTLQIIGIFGSSGAILVLTDGQYGTSTLSFWMYKQVQAGVTSEYNHVSAMGLVFTALTIPLVVGGRWIMNRFGEEVEY